MKLYPRYHTIRYMAVLATLSFCASAMSASNSVSTVPGITQKFDAPHNATISGEQLAQLSKPKIPSLANDISTASIDLSSDLDYDLNNINLDLETTGPLSPQLLSTREMESLTSTTALKFKDSLRDQSLDLQDNLLSLPPIGYDSTSETLSESNLLLSDQNYTGTSTLSYGENSSSSLGLSSMYSDSRANDIISDLQNVQKPENQRKMTLLSVVFQSLSSNQSLRIDRLSPEISNTGIESAEGEFDTVVKGGVGYSSNHSSTLGPKSKNGPDNRSDDIAISRNLNYNASIGARLPSGTDYSLSFNGNRGSTNRTDPFYNNGLNLNITQNLLRGAGSDVNLISVWTAQNNFVISLYQLQNTLINLVTDVQKAYWDLYLAYETLNIRQTAYQVAKEQRERTDEFVRVGRSAPLDALAAQAEEASRVSDIINSIANLKTRQLILLRLINPDNLSTGWRSLIFPSEDPKLPTEKLVPEERVRLARYYRPDLRQSQIDLANGELAVHRTANGLLPALDFVIDLGLTGVGDSQGDSFNRLSQTSSRNYGLGLQFSYPLQNRTAQAANRRATFQKQQAEEAIRNFCQIIDVEVRTAILEIERTTRLIYSTKVTEELRSRQLEAETEKFRVGRSTQIEVSQAQRDLVQSQLERVSAGVANINAYLELYRVEGTALQRRGIKPIEITPESGVPAG